MARMKEVRLSRSSPHVRRAIDLNVYLHRKGFDIEKPYSCRHDMDKDEYVYEQDSKAKKHQHLRLVERVKQLLH